MIVKCNNVEIFLNNGDGKILCNARFSSPDGEGYILVPCGQDEFTVGKEYKLSLESCGETS